MKKAVRLEVRLPRYDAAPSALTEYGRLFDVDLNVLRGRVTESRAWYLLDITGAARRVEALIRLFRERGLKIRTHQLELSYG
jgi:hypothetical protein